MENDIAYGGGHRTCPKCGETIWGSALHECRGPFATHTKDPFEEWWKATFQGTLSGLGSPVIEQAFKEVAQKAWNAASKKDVLDTDQEC